jgi:hypothetical protein
MASRVGSMGRALVRPRARDVAAPIRRLAAAGPIGARGTGKAMAAITGKLRGTAVYTFILAMGAAGYLDAPRWLVLPGAAALVLADWGLRGPPPLSRMVWTSKTTTYFVAGVAANLILAALAFATGRVVRLLPGLLLG